MRKEREVSFARAAATGIVCAATLTFAGLSPAVAQDYPSTTGDLSVIEGMPDNMVKAGETLTLSGGGFAPGALVTLTITDPSTGAFAVLGTVTADATGSFSTDVTVPNVGNGGMYQLSATGDGPAGGTNTLTANVDYVSSSSGTTTTTSGATTTTESNTSTTVGNTSTTTGNTSTTARQTTTTWRSTTTWRTTTTRPGQSLAVTGANALPLAGAAGALIAAGGGVLYYRRRTPVAD